MRSAKSRRNPRPEAAELLDREPPNNLEAERRVLKALICKPQWRDPLVRMLGPEHFHQHWPDRTSSAPLGSVVLLTAEDDPADTIRPRLDAAGADSSKVHILEAVEVPDLEGPKRRRRTFSLEWALPLLAEALSKMSDPKLLIIDPISAYLGRIDSHKNAEVRAALTPLVEVAQRHHVAVVGMTHLTKASGKDRTAALYRAMGSLAFVAAARAVWAVAKDQADPQRRPFVPVKSNLAKEVAGLAYHVQDVDGVPTIAWERDPVTIDIDQVLAPTPDEDGPTREDSQRWLRELLADGPIEAKIVQQKAKDAGYAWRTIQRAKVAANVGSKKEGFGEGAQWFWRLPEECQVALHNGDWHSSGDLALFQPSGGEENAF